MEILGNILGVTIGAVGIMVALVIIVGLTKLLVGMIRGTI
jgi:hypothetical protein